MSFTDIFIRRPVLSSVVSLLILLIGLSAAFNLPVRQYPELSNTTITITAPASVKANSRNSEPVRPETKPIGA